MQDTPNFGRQNELAVWLLLALCVRKMELLSARWTEFDLERGVWSLHPSRTKMNQSIDIPMGGTHRLSNPGKLPLEIIEVQSGPYLEEDDIVRFDDVYGRIKPESEKG